MHSFAPHHNDSGEASAKATKGLILKGGWRYDLHGWFIDTCLFRGKGRELRQRTVTLANLHSGEQVLDVGCGTGTLAIDIQRRVGSAAASLALTQVQSRSPVPARKRRGATCRSSSRSG